MRGLFATGCLGLCLAFAPTAKVASAQSVYAPTANREGRQVSPQASFAQELIQQRAMNDARERTARINMRAWMRQSTQRPVMISQFRNGDLFQRYGQDEISGYGRWGFYGPIPMDQVAP